MKVELDHITLGLSGITDEVYVGILAPTKTRWLHKREMTNAFLDCVIKRWENQKEIIKCGDTQWEVSVKKIEKKIEKISISDEMKSLIGVIHNVFDEIDYDGELSPSTRMKVRHLREKYIDVKTE